MSKKKWEKPDFEVLVFTETRGDNPHGKPHVADAEDGFLIDGLFVPNTIGEGEAPS